ncbi:MAG: hypothetical protein II767_04260 [Proteobacteria bacterium]|nr:hypothetical protein [Pseudomonadota bacterium]
MAEQDLVTLNHEIERAKDQLKPQILSICDVIVGDIPNFVLRQVRAAFIEDVSYAESKSDAELTELKARIAAFGADLAKEIREKLTADMETWWGPQVKLEKTGKTLEGNESIWAVLSGIAPRIAKFMESEGIRPTEIRYTTPARFIEGKYLPGMIEKYWAQLSALRALEDERTAADGEARRQRQADRWDSI